MSCRSYQPYYCPSPESPKHGCAPAVNCSTYTIGDLSVTSGKIATNAVTTGKILDSAVTSAKIDPTVVRVATGTIASAQLRAMYTTPVILIAAPGDNNYIFVENVVLNSNFGTVVFANGGVVKVQYDITAAGAGVAAAQTVAGADFITLTSADKLMLLNGALGTASNSTAITIATVENLPISISNATAAFITGDSDLVWSIRYRILPIA